jgi:adenosylmethionine-8-amino-7-oxononanoate aminotransferase
MAKGMAGGYVPLGARATRKEVVDNINKEVSRIIESFASDF